MADPVSWKVVEPGWSVLDDAGSEVGTVERIVGDPEADIFDGLAVRRGRDLMPRPAYVPSEDVGAIEEGTVHLTIDADAFGRLGDYDEPPAGGRFLAP